jgi:hypothetical protein
MIKLANKAGLYHMLVKCTRIRHVHVVVTAQSVGGFGA